MMNAEIIKDLPAEEYHRDPALNFSTLKYLWEGPPSRFKRARDKKKDEATPAMLSGRGIHSLVLEGEEAFKKKFAFKPYKGTLKKDDPIAFAAEKEALLEFEATLGAKTAIPHKSEEEFAGVAAAIKKHHGEWLAQFDLREVSIFWDDPDFGCRCKARPDAINSKTGAFMDLKTIGKTVQDFRQAALSLDYPLQVGFYARAIRAVPELAPTSFTWLVVETNEPYITKRVTLGRDDAQLVGEKVQALAESFAYYNENDHWPEATEDELFIPDWWAEKGGREAS